MQIQYASDLHLEFPQNASYMKRHPLRPVAEVLVLAGDILPLYAIEQYQDFFSYLSDQFAVTYWLPGNHEYYHYDLASRSGKLQENIRDNVFLVNNTIADHGSLRLVFSTLWSRISPRWQFRIEASLNDFRQIRFGNRKLDIEQYNQLHQDSLDFVRETVRDAARERFAVFTHHCPTFQHYPPKYKGDPLNEAFAVDADDLIENSNIAAWVYGHHHFNTPEFCIGNTRMLTNQLGYVQLQEHALFKSDCCMEL